MFWCLVRIARGRRRYTHPDRVCFMVKESGGRTEAITPVRASWREVVITGPFINFLLHNHFITEFFLKKKSGDVNDEANFSLFILLHKRAKPILPPYLPPPFRARTQNLYSPPYLIPHPPRELKPLLPPKARSFIKPLVLTLTLRLEPLGSIRVRDSIKPEGFNLWFYPSAHTLTPLLPHPSAHTLKKISLKKYFLMYYININVAVDTTR